MKDAGGVRTKKEQSRMVLKRFSPLHKMEKNAKGDTFLSKDTIHYF